MSPLEAQCQFLTEVAVAVMAGIDIEAVVFPPGDKIAIVEVPTQRRFAPLSGPASVLLALGPRRLASAPSPTTTALHTAPHDNWPTSLFKLAQGTRDLHNSADARFVIVRRQSERMYVETTGSNLTFVTCPELEHVYASECFPY